jgi:hypothetical protein
MKCGIAWFLWGSLSLVYLQWVKVQPDTIDSLSQRVVLVLSPRLVSTSASIAIGFALPLMAGCFLASYLMKRLTYEQHCGKALLLKR